MHVCDTDLVTACIIQMSRWYHQKVSLLMLGWARSSFCRLSQVPQTDLFLRWSNDHGQLTPPHWCPSAPALWLHHRSCCADCDPATPAPASYSYHGNQCVSWPTSDPLQDAGCACICCHQLSFKRFESLASPQQLTVFSLSNLWKCNLARAQSPQRPFWTDLQCNRNWLQRDIYTGHSH